MPTSIHFIHSSGSEHHSTSDEDFAGVRVDSNAGSHDDTDESYENSERDYDLVDDFDDDIEPSDSASRPRATRSNSRHRAPSESRPAAPRRSRTHAAAAPEAPPPRRRRPLHREPYSRERSEHSAPRRRPVSGDLDDVAYEDDYPGYPSRGPPPGHHPHNQWAHIPSHPGATSGYAPSMMSGYQPNPFNQGMERALVHMPNDPYGYQANPFAPSHANPFSPPNQSMVGGGFYDPSPAGPRPGIGRQRHSIHGAMPGGQPPVHPAGAMMAYYQGFDQHYGMPPPMPYGYPPGPGGYRHSPDHSPDPGRRERARSKPSTPPAAAPPPPPPPIAVAPPPPPPPPALGPINPTPAEKEAMTRAAENADRLKKLEELLMAQAQAKTDKEAAKQRALEDAAIAEAEAKKKGEEDKLAKLHDLIIAQREEQKARDQAIEAARAAEKAEADAKAAKDAAEKKKAAEDAGKLLAAAKKAREEAEAKAAEEAKAAKEAHEKALAEAAAAAEELKKAKEEAEKKAADEAKAKEEAEKKAAAAAAPAPEEKKPPIKFKDAVGRKFSFPWHICCTWKGMEELIKQAFLHVDVIGQHVHDGHYDLVGPDGEIILPQVWETMVQPDWTITMHMWPMEDPAPKSPPPPPPPPMPPLGDPWVGVDMPHRHPSKGKGRGDKVHKILGDPPMPKNRHRGGGGMMPPPPPPPPPIIVDVGEGPAGVHVVSPGMPPPGMHHMGPMAPMPKPKPAKPKPQPNVGFLRWTAGGAIRPAGKGAKKPESPTGGGGGGPTSAATHGGHSQHNGNADAGCVVM